MSLYSSTLRTPSYTKYPISTTLPEQPGTSNSLDRRPIILIAPEPASLCLDEDEDLWATDSQSQAPSPPTTCAHTAIVDCPTAHTSDDDDDDVPLTRPAVPHRRRRPQLPSALTPHPTTSDELIATLSAARDPQPTPHSPYPSPPSTSSHPRKPIPLPSMFDPQQSWGQQHQHQQHPLACPPLSPPPTSPLPTRSLPEDGDLSTTTAAATERPLTPLSTDLDARPQGVPQLLTPESPPWPEPLPSIAEEGTTTWSSTAGAAAMPPPPQPPPYHRRDYPLSPPSPLSTKFVEEDDDDELLRKIPGAWLAPLVAQLPRPIPPSASAPALHWPPASPDASHSGEGASTSLSRMPTLDSFHDDRENSTRSSTLESVALATPESHTLELHPEGIAGVGQETEEGEKEKEGGVYGQKVHPWRGSTLHFYGHDDEEDDSTEEQEMFSPSPRVHTFQLPEMDELVQPAMHWDQYPSGPVFLSSPRGASMDLPELVDDHHHVTFTPLMASPVTSNFQRQASEDSSMDSPPASPARRCSVDLPSFDNALLAPLQPSPPSMLSMIGDLDTITAPTEHWNLSPPLTMVHDFSPSPSRRSSQLAGFDEVPLASGSPQLPDLDIILAGEPEEMASPSGGSLLSLPDTESTYGNDWQTSASLPHNKQLWQTPHPLVTELPSPYTPSSGLLFDMPVDPPTMVAGVSPPDEDPLLQDLDVPLGALEDPTTELGRLWSLRQRSLSAERAAREVEAQLAARVAVLEASLLHPSSAEPPPPPSALLASALAIGEAVGCPGDGSPRAELATLASVRAEAKRLRKREKERAREVGALLRLKLGACEAVGGAGAAKGLTRGPRELAAKMVFRRHEASAKPLVGRPRAAVAGSPLLRSYVIAADEEDADVDAMLI